MSKKRAADDEDPSSSASSSKDDSDSASHNKKKLRKDDENDNVRDACFGFQHGDRIEVEWVLHFREEEETKKDETTTSDHWWGATLLPFDGRYYNTTKNDDEHQAQRPIRVLEYDAYPEKGFPERSQEDVVFLDEHTLLLLDREDDDNEDDNVTYFRKEGSDWEAPPNEEEDEDLIAIPDDEATLRHVLDTLLQESLQNNLGTQFQSLSAAQQHHVAERIANGKEKLIETILQHDKAVITAADVPELLQKAWKDM